jgi:hypothetical protein
MHPLKKARTNSGSNATIDDLTALTTAQLYSLSSRRHRDESRESVRRAQEEHDRARVSLEQSQKWLERANEHLERMEENAKESQREYLDAMSLLARVRQAVSGVDAPPPPYTHTPDCFYPRNATDCAS